VVSIEVSSSCCRYVPDSRIALANLAASLLYTTMIVPASIELGGGGGGIIARQEELSPSKCSHCRHTLITPLYNETSVDRVATTWKIQGELQYFERRPFVWKLGPKDLTGAFARNIEEWRAFAENFEVLLVFFR
jgi:hypothetical protein